MLTRENAAVFVVAALVWLVVLQRPLVGRLERPRGSVDLRDRQRLTAQKDLDELHDPRRGGEEIASV